MTIEQMIVQYLYKNKTVTLQNIGTFTIAGDVEIPYTTDGETVLPENAIEYKYNNHAQEDQGLIDFIIENSGKIRPLAISDLESYIILNKQFINIGKPHTITGLGTLTKSQKEDYTFVQAAASNVVTKEAPRVVKEKIKSNVDFDSPKKETGNSNVAKFAIMGLLGILLLGGLAYGGYWIYENYKSNSMETPVAKKTADSLNSNANTNNADTSLKDTSFHKTMPISTAKDSNSFYIVIKEFPTAAEAQKRMEKLNSYGNHFVVTTKDSITYKMKLPFIKPLSDTLRIKDSVNTYFSAKGYVELPQ